MSDQARAISMFRAMCESKPVLQFVTRTVDAGDGYVNIFLADIGPDYSDELEVIECARLANMSFRIYRLGELVIKERVAA